MNVHDGTLSDLLFDEDDEFLDALEAACARWDLDPSDFGMERTDCKDCYMNDDCCTCEDCYMQYDPEYCPKKKEMRE